MPEEFLTPPSAVRKSPPSGAPDTALEPVSRSPEDTVKDTVKDTVEDTSKNTVDNISSNHRSPSSYRASPPPRPDQRADQISAPAGGTTPHAKKPLPESPPLSPNLPPDLSPDLSPNPASLPAADSKRRLIPRLSRLKPRLTKQVLKRLFYGLAGLGIAGVIALAFRPSPILVDVAPVSRGPLQVTITAEGKTRVKDRYVVAAPVAGRLARINLDVGDRVSANQPVAQLDPLPLNNQVDAAQARLSALEAQLRGVETQRPKSEQLLQAQARLRSAEAAQQAAEAAVAQAQAQWEQAKRDRDRTAELESQGAVSRRELEVAQTTERTLARTLEAAREQLTQAQQAVAAAAAEIPLLRSEQADPDYLLSLYRSQMAAVEAELSTLADEASRTTLTAPASGEVLRLMEESSRFVQAGDPLLEIGNPQDLELVIDVLSSDAVKVQPGQTIVVSQWGGPETLMAKVTAIEPAAFTEVSTLGVEEQRVNIIGELVNPASISKTALGDGYRIEADIVIWADEEALQVPVSALFRCQSDRWCLFTVKDGRAHQQSVDIGPRNPFSAAVTDGLKAQTPVILHPNEKITEGTRVNLR